MVLVGVIGWMVGYRLIVLCSVVNRLLLLIFLIMLMKLILIMFWLFMDSL